jgi:hypothetical protein
MSKRELKGESIVSYLSREVAETNPPSTHSIP